MKSQRENPDETQRLPHRNPHCFHSQSPSLISLSVCGLVLLHLPLLKTLSSIADFVFAGIILEMRRRTQLNGCARRGGSWVNGYRQRLLGQWLLSAAARACAVGGGSYSLGYCRRRLRFDFFPLSLSLLLWVFFFFFPLRKSWVFTTGRTVENKFFNLVLLNFFFSCINLVSNFFN